MNNPELPPYQQWREIQIRTRTPYVPFTFCGTTYHVAIMPDDGRRVLVGEVAAQTKQVA